MLCTKRHCLTGQREDPFFPPPSSGVSYISPRPSKATYHPPLLLRSPILVFFPSGIARTPNPRTAIIHRIDRAKLALSPSSPATTGAAPAALRIGATIEMLVLRGARSLRSVVVAFARLAHVLSRALMSLCSPTASAAATVAPWQLHQPARVAAPPKTKAHPAEDHHQLLLVSPPAPPPPALLFKQGEGNNNSGSKAAAAEETRRKKTAARGRPPRLVIPPPVARATGADPFGAAADRETDVATEVEVRGEGFCLASRRGVRHAMEDGYGVVTDHSVQGGSKLAFYGVYDGHGGRAAVDFVADRLGRSVVAATAAAAAAVESSRQPPPAGQEEDDGIAAAIRSAYLSTDSEFLSQGVRSGACATTALVKDGELYVAHVGDCRAVLGTRGGVATALTTDHTAGREDERRRIESSGGYVSCGSSGVWRVQDCLAVSRAFGDASMKPWVTCEPEVSRRRLTPDCRFLLLASDGLWNKVSCQEAVDVVHAAAAGSSASCKELVAMARARGSRDDITVMLVDLQRFLG